MLPCEIVGKVHSQSDERTTAGTCHARVPSLHISLYSLDGQLKVGMVMSVQISRMWTIGGEVMTTSPPFVLLHFGFDMSPQD